MIDWLIDTMFQDGFVMDVQGVRFADHADYIAVKAKVRWLFYCFSWHM